MEDLIHRTSQTLQLLIEYDPVRQRLDRLRLGTPTSRLGVPAASRLRLSSPTDGVIERTDNDDGTLKRRSLRLGIQTDLVLDKVLLYNTGFHIMMKIRELSNIVSCYLNNQ